MVARDCAVLQGSTDSFFPLRTLFSLGATNDAFSLSAILIIMSYDYSFGYCFTFSPGAYLIPAYDSIVTGTGRHGS